MHQKILNYPLYQSGFKSKTINVRTQSGKSKFLLQQVNELGLPHDAQIVALLTRENSNSFTASNGLKLATTAVYDTAYLTLKDRANSQNKIDRLFSDYYIPKLDKKAFFMQPVPSKLIDWNQSFIQINNSTPALDGEVFEIVVIYSDPCQEEKFPNRFIFRDGLELSGLRTASFEVLLNNSQTVYPLSNSDNVGLDQEAIILGFDLKNNTQPLYQNTPMDSSNRQSTYFTLKQGTNAFIDQFPCGITDYEKVISSLDYFPIVPTQVLAIDWQQSKIEIRDNSNIVDGMVFQFTLYWWNPNC